MKQRFNLFKKIFSTGRGEWIVFIFSLLLAFFMWSIQRFSQEYSTFLKFQVNVDSPISGREQRSTASNLLMVKGKCSGFYVLNHYLLHNEEPKLSLSLPVNMINKLNDTLDLFYVKSLQVSTLIQDAIGQDFECERFITDTLFFNIPVESYKKVPVVINSSLDYMPQYMGVDELTIKPDSVLIYGDESIIELIDSVFTQTVYLDKVSKYISGVVDLKPIKGVTSSVSEVFYSQQVERYVECSITLPIAIFNAPNNINVAVVPSQINLKYRIPFEDNHRITSSDFLVVVDYNEIESVGGGVMPKIIRAPKSILSTSIDPIFVESIVLN